MGWRHSGTIGWGGAAVLCASLLTAGSASGQENPEWWSGVMDTLPPGVTVLALDSLYAFEADTEQAISAALEDYGPQRGAQAFHGEHRYAWRYHYDWEEVDAGRCRITRTRLLLRSVLVLPHLRNSPGLPTALRNRWIRYTGALRVHEEGHRAITERELDTAWREISGLPALPCGELADAVDPLLTAAGERIRTAQAAYDETTGHGTTQGAVWPTRPRR